MIQFQQTDNFPTELVIGGTLGSLSLLTIFLLVVACIRKWRIENERYSIHDDL